MGSAQRKPVVIDTPSAMSAAADAFRREGKTIAFVPTMGYLHDGHAALLRKGRELGDVLVLSIFVNPTQFGANEDLDKYPRDFERDEAIAAAEGTDVIFYPTPANMYPDGYQTEIRVQRVSGPLCGATRPVHFAGVATVCAKLFNIVKPHFAVFGEKDFQQVLVIDRLVRDLNMDLVVVPHATVREADGLAMSSRNVYLSAEERAQAVALSGALAEARALTEAGERDAGVVLSAVRARLAEATLGRLDYAELRDLPNLEPTGETIRGPALLALAVFFDKARLIDNTVLLRDQWEFHHRLKDAKDVSPRPGGKP